MGACVSSSISIQATYNERTISIEANSIVSLRLQIIKDFGINESFQILHANHPITNNSQLMIAYRGKKVLKLQIELTKSRRRTAKTQSMCEFPLLDANLDNLPSESAPANISNLNISAIHPNFTELAYHCFSNSFVTYHPYRHRVTYYKLEKVFENFCITPTPIGFIIHQNDEIYNFNLLTLQDLPKAPSNHLNHAGLLHKSFYVAIGGQKNMNVESLHLHSLRWSKLPPLPFPIEWPGACSSGDFIYVVGGKIEEKSVNSVWKFEREWKLLNWKLPWNTIGPGIIAIGQEIIVFGGQQGEKTQYFVIEDEKEILNGLLGFTAFFHGRQCGKVNLHAVIASTQGQFFKYDSNSKKFFLCSIGNYTS
jgi:hypothetical protein